MSLEDAWNDVALGGDDGGEEHTWRADWAGDTGTITTGALPDDFDPQNFDEVLARLGYSPGEIRMELLSASRWEQRSAVRDEDGRRTGEMASTWLNAYKYKAVRNALCVNLPALYAEMRRSRPAKPKPRSTGRTAVVCWADIQTGKALADDTPVLTTEGWKNHGDIRPNDYVYGSDGQPKRVYGVTGSTVQKLYRVEFDRGVSVIATGDHLWQGWRKYRVGDKRIGSRTDGSRRYGGGGQYEWRELTWTTEQIAALNGKQRSFQVDLTAPLEFPEADLPIDPYLLGVWLGDGNSHCAHITVGREDEDWVTQLGTLVPSNCSDTKVGVHVPGLRTKLRETGLLRNKHIPAQYLTASVKQRLALVQGLMDTDGSCDRRGQAEFCNTNFDIADGVCALLSSLGYKYTRTERIGTLDGQQHKPFVRVSIPTRPDMSLFTLRRKSERESAAPPEQTLRRQVQRVVPVGEGSAQCLKVEGGLYLAGRELVVTHNCDHQGGVTELLERLDEKRAALKGWLKDVKVDHVVVADVGDILEGFENVASQTRTNGLSLQAQVDLAATEFWRTIKLAERFGPVDVLSIPSNHCQWRRGKSLIGRPNDDWGIHISQRLERLNEVAGLRVAFHRPATDWDETLTFKIRGSALGLAHGHQAKTPAGIIPWWKSQKHDGKLMCDVLLTGHFHYPSFRPSGRDPVTGKSSYHIQASTLDNGSSWVANTIGEDGDPALTVFMFDDDGFDQRSFALL